MESPHLEQLEHTFAQHYRTLRGAYLVRAPGRVNLIGDHVDYSGLSVLPMALQRHVAILYCERHDSTVRVVSTDPNYTLRSFDLGPSIEPYPEGDWGNYAKAAGQALAQRCGELRGFDAAVHSDIPVAAGLSSSSALVVAAALAVLHANDIEMEKLLLAELLTEAEHYVGTRGGGMDQAICLAARRGSASRIDFNPLRLTAHPIPPDWGFIVAFSLVRAEKSATGRETYNLRTRECRDALQRVTAALQLADRIDSYPALMAELPPADLVSRAEEALEGTLLRRFRHVVSEADRVHRAERALIDYDLKGFGRLMTESHESLRDDFAVSCPELDELVEITLRAGAAGARLTGAGLGGCVVTLVTERRANKVLKALAKRFYASREFEGRLEDQLFLAEPSAGASVAAL
ncbi:MAG: galactokinase [Gemmatimonadota bacterium]|nr:MAG: galactokinase [Gemmatimonadota bacterium]